MHAPTTNKQKQKETENTQARKENKKMKQIRLSPQTTNQIWDKGMNLGHILKINQAPAPKHNLISVNADIEAFPFILIHHFIDDVFPFICDEISIL